MSALGGLWSWLTGGGRGVAASSNPPQAPSSPPNAAPPPLNPPVLTVAQTPPAGPVTVAALTAAWPGVRAAAGWVPLVNAALRRFGCEHPLVAAAYLGQTGHESGGGARLAEDLHYTTADRLRAVFPSFFVTGPHRAEDYLRNPRKLALLVYGGRLGNRPGTDDGYVFRGGGLIQLTFRSGFEGFGKAVGMSAEDAATYARTREGAAMSAAWYARDRGLVAPALAGDFDLVALMTAGIQAMTPAVATRISYADRLGRYRAARKAMGV